MKRVLLVLLIIASFPLLLLSGEEDGPQISFDREVHDFGDISSDNVPEGKLRFMVFNKGNRPLVITNVRACCGTRVNGFTEAPISPSDTGYVEVQFRIVPQPHRIRRTVTVQSNDSERQTAILRIIGEVTDPKGDISLQEE